MALIVEDGTGKSDAEAYSSVAQADTYFANRGDTVWASLTTAAKEEALRKGCDYIQAKYWAMWGGGQTTTTQALDWPRSGVKMRATSGQWLRWFPSDEIPPEVVRANIILAGKSRSDDILADLEQGVVSESVGGAITTVYSEFSPQEKRYLEVDRLLSRYFSGTGVSGPTHRVVV